MTISIETTDDEMSQIKFPFWFVEPIMSQLSFSFVISFAVRNQSVEMHFPFRFFAFFFCHFQFVENDLMQWNHVRCFTDCNVWRSSLQRTESLSRYTRQLFHDDLGTWSGHCTLAIFNWAQLTIQICIFFLTKMRRATAVRRYDGIILFPFIACFRAAAHRNEFICQFSWKRNNFIFFANERGMKETLYCESRGVHASPDML